MNMHLTYMLNVKVCIPAPTQNPHKRRHTGIHIHKAKTFKNPFLDAFVYTFQSHFKYKN